MNDIEILVGAPGCGKTDQLRKEATNQPGLYLFCLPTIDLIKEQVARLEVEAKGLIVLRADSGTGRGAVQRKLDSARAQITASGSPHAIVFATHITLMQADLSGFVGWHTGVVASEDRLRWRSVFSSSSGPKTATTRHHRPLSGGAAPDKHAGDRACWPRRRQA